MAQAREISASALRSRGKLVAARAVDSSEHEPDSSENELVTNATSQRARRAQWLSWGTSFLVHLNALVLLALAMTPGEERPFVLSITAGFSRPDPHGPPLVTETTNLEFSPTAVAAAAPELTIETALVSAPSSSNLLANDGTKRPADAETIRWEAHDLSRSARVPQGGGFEGRQGDLKSKLLQVGGTAESEAAVRRGLDWLVSVQRSNGSWHFNHGLARPNQPCLNPGTVGSSTGATAIALLAFFGAGQTHRAGEYQDTVYRGLRYLMDRKLSTPHGLDYQEGSMYAQGITAIALCEAFAMTQDRELKDLAQGALDFIVAAQDPKGGGWRYMPGMPGDTSMHGWQWMALKSGQMAYLHVPAATLTQARLFLDTVQTEYGAKYHYQATVPGDGQATTAIGLLCRMYQGWPREEPALAAGINYLDRWGPSRDNMYYNYYATQVLRHWGGPEWERWNYRMRSQLLRTQVANGPEAGSWYFSGGHSESGGRHFNTAMSIMTLEVYYRYLPLYQSDTLGDDF